MQQQQQQQSISDEVMGPPISSSANTSNKRHRRSLEDDDDDGDDHKKEKTAAVTTAGASSDAVRSNKKPAAPPYGSQAYWEERYQTQFASLQPQDEQKQKKVEPMEEEEDTTTTLPYHSWYFSYDELRPLLLPLLLGGREAARSLLLQNDDDDDDEQDDDEQSGCEEEEVDDDEEVDGSGAGAVQDGTSSAKQESDEDTPAAATSASNKPSSNKEVAIMDEKKTEAEDEDFQKAAEQSPKNESDMNENGADFEDEEDDNQSSSDGDDDDEDSSPDRQDGLASLDGPVAILELGCGDVPLGAALALELRELQQTTGSAARNVVQQILCTDYSPTVIETMRRQYGCKDDSCTPETVTTVTTPAINTQQSLPTVDIGNIPLEFATVDARSLPYESNTFALVMEKGTLDAMLSDETHGARECISIVAECARVVKVGGCIMLVSHLNAHTANGMRWLEEVVFAGLQQFQSHSQKQNDNNTGATRKDDTSFANSAPYSSNSTVTWEIEVHGHDEVPQEEDEDGNDGVESSRSPSNSAGPAVYIIHKKTRMANDDPQENGTTDANAASSKNIGDSSHPTIPVKFFTY